MSKRLALLIEDGKLIFKGEPASMPIRWVTVGGDRKEVDAYSLINGGIPCHTENDLTDEQREAGTGEGDDLDLFDETGAPTPKLHLIIANNEGNPEPCFASFDKDAADQAYNRCYADNVEMAKDDAADDDVVEVNGERFARSDEYGDAHYTQHELTLDG